MNFVPLELSNPGFDCFADTRLIQMRVAELQSKLGEVRWSEPVPVNKLVNKHGKLNLRFRVQKGCKSLGSQLVIEVRVVGEKSEKFTKVLEIINQTKLCSPVALVIDNSQVLKNK